MASPRSYLIAVAIAIATVDPKTLVGPVQARVKAETGRDLVFGGPIDLRLSLEPKLIASDVTLSNAPGARSPLMAQVKRVEVQVALLPLLQRRFEVVEVALVEPTIMLETDAQGRANWEFGVPSAAPASAPTPPPVSAASVIAVGNIVIRDGKLTYTDGATGKTTNVTIGHLAMRSRKGDAPIDAEFRGKIDDVAVAVTGNLGPLDALREGRWPYPVAIKGDIAGRPANVSTKIGVQGETTTLDALDLTWGTLALKGQVRAVRANGRTRYEFDLSSPSMSLQDAAFAGAAAAGPTAAASAVAGAKSAPPSRFVVSDRPLPLVALEGRRSRRDAFDWRIDDQRTQQAARRQSQGRERARQSRRADVPRVGLRRHARRPRVDRRAPVRMRPPSSCASTGATSTSMRCSRPSAKTVRCAAARRQ